MIATIITFSLFVFILLYSLIKWFLKNEEIVVDICSYNEYETEYPYNFKQPRDKHHKYPIDTYKNKFNKVNTNYRKNQVKTRRNLNANRIKAI